MPQRSTRNFPAHSASVVALEPAWQGPRPQGCSCSGLALRKRRHAPCGLPPAAAHGASRSRGGKATASSAETARPLCSFREPALCARPKETPGCLPSPRSSPRTDARVRGSCARSRARREAPAAAQRHGRTTRCQRRQQANNHPSDLTKAGRCAGRHLDVRCSVPVFWCLLAEVCPRRRFRRTSPCSCNNLTLSAGAFDARIQ